VALANIISESGEWPFKSISYEQYLLLSASDKREIESILGIKAEKKALRKKVKAVN